MPFKPYFYIAVMDNTEREMMQYLPKKFKKIFAIKKVKKEDLDLVSWGRCAVVEM